MYRITIYDIGKIILINNMEVRSPVIFKICNKDLLKTKNKINTEAILKYKIEKCNDGIDPCCS